MGNLPKTQGKAAKIHLFSTEFLRLKTCHNQIGVFRGEISYLVDEIPLLHMGISAIKLKRH
jgi:hypothetical protein